MMDDLTASERTAQYVVLGLDRELFAIEVDRVREILDNRPITRLPQAPSCVPGMIDVRGRTVPVIDLRARLGLPSVEAGAGTRIIVLDVPAGSREVEVGMVVDRVHEVSALSDRALEAPPEIGLRWRSEFIRGIGRRNDAFVIVLNLAHLLGSEETALIAATNGERTA